MYQSKYNQIYSLVGGKCLLLNLLSGQADIISLSEKKWFDSNVFPEKRTAYLLDRGYFYKKAYDERILFLKKYREFKKERKTAEIQFILSLGQLCNFKCGYCYEAGSLSGSVIGIKRINKAIKAMERLAGKRDFYITLFGGEPLLDTPDHRKAVEHLVNYSVSKNKGLCVVTNGYHLSEYLPLLSKAKLREIQVTLDGPPEIHNKRRPLFNGAPTFARVVKGIDAALERGFSINLRIVIDRENISGLTQLSDFIIKKKWHTYKNQIRQILLPPPLKKGERGGFIPKQLFKFQIGRNYELFHCSSKPDTLYQRADLWQAITKRLMKSNSLRTLLRPYYHGMRGLLLDLKYPDALFDDCPAAKSEWALSSDGKIYTCTAGIGNPDFVLGEYDPSFRLYENKTYEWRKRDILNIPDCRDCGVSVVCGGGCGVIAKNKNGKVLSPDCRPVREIQQTGARYYYLGV